MALYPVLTAEGTPPETLGLKLWTYEAGGWDDPGGPGYTSTDPN